MALILLAGAGYAYYQQQEARFKIDEDIDLDDPTLKTLEFLPMELSSNILQSTLTTITFFEGTDYSHGELEELLKTRVELIRAANPWLGGILAQRRQDSQMKLWYGGEKLTTPSSFQSFGLGEIPLTSATPYPRYDDLVRDFGLKVPVLNDLVGTKQNALWRVSLIPDAAAPNTRFALIVSMAHILGDNHTFYQLHGMLTDLDQPAEDVVEELNPIRIPEFQKELIARLGDAETSYMMKINPQVWERPGKGSELKHEVLLFTVKKEWLQEKHSELRRQAIGKLEVEEAHGISDEALLAHWYFASVVEPSVGFVSRSVRNYCQCLGELDAGNYQTPIPLTEVDYETPQKLQRGLGSGHRSAHASSDELSLLPTALVTGLPQTTFGVGVDWRRFFQGEMRLLSSSSFIRQGLHLPIHDTHDIRCIPPRVSALVTFSATPDTIGALCVLSREKAERVIQSGIIDTTIALIC